MTVGVAVMRIAVEGEQALGLDGAKPERRLPAVASGYERGDGGEGSGRRWSVRRTL